MEFSRPGASRKNNPIFFPKVERVLLNPLVRYLFYYL